MKVPIILRVVLAAGVLIVGIAWQVLRMRHDLLQPDASETAKIYDCSGDRTSPEVRATDAALIDVTQETGLDFQHVVGPLGTYFMPESIGAGGAFFDSDGDGLLDLYLVNCGRSPGARGEFPEGTRSENRMFRQVRSGRFVDVTADSGLGDTGYGAGCAVADVDNDGDLDVYVTNYGQDRLFLNDGQGRFSDVAESAGLRESDWGTAAAFFDYDRDGWLDLVVVNYTADPQYGHSVGCGFEHGQVSYCGPKKFQPTIDRLFHNDGLRVAADGSATIQFSDVTSVAGFDQAKTYGFGAACGDWTGDGWPDVLITNDGAPNRLWVNQKDGRFVDEAPQRNVAVNGLGFAEAGMGVAVGDLNRDERSDFLITHLTTETATLYLSEGAGQYQDRTELWGVRGPTHSHTGWGVALVDLDLDGRLDAPIVNGLVIPCHSGFPFHGEDNFQVRHDVIARPDAFWREYADDNLLLMGADGDSFQPAANLGGDFCTAVASGRALLCGDYDNDGDVDLLVTNCGSGARLYRNDLPRRGHWLEVRLLDPALKRDAIGATAIVRVRGASFQRLAGPYSSYLASHDPRLHFGLGEVGTFDELIVRWPDGPVETATEVFSGGAADRSITIRRGTGRTIEEH